MKTKTKSLFRSLPPEDQQKIIDLCNRHTYDEVLEILVKPRPEGLQLQTSYSALCRFYCSWNSDARKTKILNQTASSLQYCRQEGRGSFRAAIVTMLETKIFEALRDGAAVSDLQDEFAALKEVHKSFLAEEKWRRESDARPEQEWRQHLSQVLFNNHYDFVPVDQSGQPTEPPPLSQEETAQLQALDPDADQAQSALARLDETIACHGEEAARLRACAMGLPRATVKERVDRYRQSLRERGVTALQAAREVQLASLKRDAQLARAILASSQKDPASPVDLPASHHQKTPVNPHNPPKPA